MTRKSMNCNYNFTYYIYNYLSYKQFYIYILQKHRFWYSRKER